MRCNFTSYGRTVFSGSPLHESFTPQLLESLYSAVLWHTASSLHYVHSLNLNIGSRASGCWCDFFLDIHRALSCRSLRVHHEVRQSQLLLIIDALVASPKETITDDIHRTGLESNFSPL